MPEIILSQRDFNQYTIPDRPMMPAVDVASDSAGVINLSKSVNYCTISADFDFWFVLEGENDPLETSLDNQLTAWAAENPPIAKPPEIAEYLAAWGWFPLPMKQNYNKIHYKRKSGAENGRIVVWEGK